jgi:hypothetical protein
VVNRGCNGYSIRYTSTGTNRITVLDHRIVAEMIRVAMFVFYVISYRCASTSEENLIN